MPQVGYLVSPRFMLSAWGRFQLVRGADDYHTPAGSTQCGATVSARPRAGPSPASRARPGSRRSDHDVFRPYLSLSIGGGQIRQVVHVTSGNGDCGADRQQATCADTAALGPFLAGPGIGFHVRVARAVRLIFAVQSIFGAPRFAADIDADVGVAVVVLAGPQSGRRDLVLQHVAERHRASVDHQRLVAPLAEHGGDLRVDRRVGRLQQLDVGDACPRR